jgi:hypothetical protein
MFGAPLCPKTTGGNQLYNTLELLMMGLMVPETCWANNKICNKNHLLHLVGILFPHINEDARSKSLQIPYVTLRFLCTRCNNLFCAGYHKNYLKFNNLNIFVELIPLCYILKIDILLQSSTISFISPIITSYMFRLHWPSSDVTYMLFKNQNKMHIYWICEFLNFKFIYHVLSAWRRSVRPKHVAGVDRTDKIRCGWQKFLTIWRLTATLVVVPHR